MHLPTVDRGKISVLEGFFFVWVVFLCLFIDQSVREIKREDKLQRLAEKQQQQTNPKMYFKIFEISGICLTTSEEEKQT